MVRKDKRTKRPLTDHWELPLSPENLLARGHMHFDREDYTAAIRIWERLRDEQTMSSTEEGRLMTSLAEAHFRRGVTSLPSSMADLERAVELAPAEHRYRYHLGKAYYQRGDWPSAVKWYGSLVEGPQSYSRAVVPLAAALLSSQVDVTRHPVWHLLSVQDQTWLLHVLTLMNASGVKLRAPVGSAPAGEEPFWDNLLGVVAGQRQAGVMLEKQMAQGGLPPLCEAVGHHYLGILAWHAGDFQRAAAAWKMAMDLGLHTSWARHNLYAACQRLAGELLSEMSKAIDPSAAAALLGPVWHDRMLQALHWADLGLLVVPDDKLLLAVKRQVLFHLGYAAAISGDWAQAAEYWQSAKEAGDTTRRLLINLAIASEQLGQYALAADCWGQVVRRRPKRSDAANAWDQEQVARMWRHVAENYRRAGDYEAATRTYRNAVKWAPEDVSLKLDLVEALMADGRPRAAFTVVDEILRNNPDNVDALSWQATIREDDGFYAEALRLWRRVLTLQPDNLRSRMHMAGLHESDGDRKRRAGHIGSALAAYHEGLKYMPENPRLHTSIAVCHAEKQDIEMARQHFDTALEKASNLLEAYYWVIRAWLYLENWEEVQALMHQMEELRPPPSGRLYVEMAEYTAYLGHLEWIDYFLERAHSLEPDNTQLLVEIALVLGENGQQKKAISYLKRAVQMAPQSSVAHMWLGNYYFSFLQEPELAEKHWVRAEELARSGKNLGILFQMRMIRGYVRGQRVTDAIDGAGHETDASLDAQGD